MNVYQGLTDQAIAGQQPQYGNPNDEAALYAILTGLQQAQEQQQAPVQQAPVQASAPMASQPQPEQSAPMASAVNGNATPWYKNQDLWDQIQVFGAALSQDMNGTTNAAHLGNALNVRAQYAGAKKKQTADDARTAKKDQVDNDYKQSLTDAQKFKLQQDKNNVELEYQTAVAQKDEAVSKVDKTKAEVAIKQLELKILQLYGDKEAQAKIDELRAKADKAQSEVKGLNAPAGSEQHFSAWATSPTTKAFLTQTNPDFTTSTNPEQLRPLYKQVFGTDAPNSKAKAPAQPKSFATAAEAKAYLEANGKPATQANIDYLLNYGKKK